MTFRIWYESIFGSPVDQAEPGPASEFPSGPAGLNKGADRIDLRPLPNEIPKKLADRTKFLAALRPTQQKSMKK